MKKYSLILVIIIAIVTVSCNSNNYVEGMLCNCEFQERVEFYKDGRMLAMSVVNGELARSWGTYKLGKRYDRTKTIIINWDNGVEQRGRVGFLSSVNTDNRVYEMEVESVKYHRTHGITFNNVEDCKCEDIFN